MRVAPCQIYIIVARCRVIIAFTLRHWALLTPRHASYADIAAATIFAAIPIERYAVPMLMAARESAGGAGRCQFRVHALLSALHEGAPASDEVHSDIKI